MTTAEIIATAQLLRPAEKLALIDALLASLDEPDPAIEAVWAAEAQDRLAAYERGDLKAEPIESLLAQMHPA